MRYRVYDRPHNGSEFVAVELCRSNSLGPRYSDSSVIEIRTVSRAEAERLIAIKTTDGTFWREQQDKSGA